MHNTFRLDESATHRALQSCIEKRVPVVIESPSLKGVTINGALISADAKSLLIEVTGRPAVDLGALSDVVCEGQIYGERRFSFSSKFESTFGWGGSQCLSIQRPAALTVVERRRFIRAKLAPSSKVTLEWRFSGASHRQQANLLNVSAEGLACRIGDDVAATLQASERVQVSFDLPGSAGTNELTAMVTNKVPGSEGCTLVGLHFIRSEGDAPVIARLRATLEARSDRSCQMVGGE